MNPTCSEADYSFLFRLKMDALIPVAFHDDAG